jgi:hypothetical protein
MGNPTMEGHRFILLMVVSGMTQHLAKVQGMPREVEAKIECQVCKFLWADKKVPTVNKETVYAPEEVGGRNLLNVAATCDLNPKSRLAKLNLSRVKSGQVPRLHSTCKSFQVTLS